MKLKRTTTILLVFTLSVLSISAKDIGRMMKKYGKSDHFEYVNINKTMLVMARAMADKEAREVLSKIKNMKVLVAKKEADSAPLLAELNNLTQKENYELVADVTEKGDHAKVYSKEIKPGTTELLVVTNGKNGEVNVALVTGSLTPEEFEKLNKRPEKKE